MTPHTQDADFTLYQGDCVDVLQQLPSSSVHCCVTSPPYWGLRDYGTGTWDGGDPDCDHKKIERIMHQGRQGNAYGTPPGAGRIGDEYYKEDCGKCGATRVDQQLGLEATPDQYLQRMVDVFREVRRVLRDDGTLWLNLGDSYWNGGGEKRDGGHGFVDGGKPKLEAAKGSLLSPKMDPVSGWKPKDMCGIPWRLAFALQADGWWLRSDIIWSKPNPMPESVTDRPTKSHEYVFLLTKSARYYYDADAVREPHTEPWRSGTAENRLMKKGTDGHDATFGGWDYAQRLYNPAGRNVRSVWEIATQPYAEAHFATFPQELARRCIAAGSPLGGTVLDPFLGSGTTALVARNQGRSSIGIELNPDYCQLAARRLQQQTLFA